MPREFLRDGLLDPRFLALDRAFPCPVLRGDQLRISSRQGYNLLHWVQAGTTFWVVSDAAVPELQEFVADYVKESAAEEAPAGAPAR